MNPADVFVEAERQTKILLDGIFGGAGPMADRISVGWPDEDWFANVAFPRAVVFKDKSRLVEVLRDGRAQRSVVVQGQNYKENWYPAGRLEIDMVCALQTENSKVGADVFEASLYAGLPYGLVFPAAGDWAKEFQVWSLPDAVDLKPKPDAARRIFELQMRITLRARLYRVAREYPAETQEITVEEE